MDGDVVDFDAAFCEELFDISIGQAVSEVPADGEHDDFGWELVSSERGTIHMRWLFVAMNHLTTLAEGPIEPLTQQCPLSWDANST